MKHILTIRKNLREIYSDVYTHEVLLTLSALSRFNQEIKGLMTKRLQRRTEAA